jgi:hypothetical protein
MKKLIYSFLLVALVAGMTTFPVFAATMSFYVTSVSPNESVSVHTNGFPERTNLAVTMGPAGSAGLGFPVTTTYTGEGGVLNRTFAIPEGLWGVGTIILRFESADGQYVAYGPFVNQVGGSSKPSGGSGTSSGKSSSSSGLQLYVVSVEPDDFVSVRTGNFPPTTFFNVYMGRHGTNGAGGILVARTNSGDGSSFGVNYTIPESLYGQSVIDLLMVGDNNAGSVSIAFSNTSGGGAVGSSSSGSSSGTSSGTGTSGSAVSYVPTFTIMSVVPGESVTIRTYNFPPAQAFTVRMGPYGTYGMNGEIVGTTDSGAGGSFDATYSIPAGLKTADAIAIRMDSAAGFYAYNWFTNMGTTASVPPAVPAATPVPGTTAVPPVQAPAVNYTGFPYFFIDSVVANSSVTITGYNFIPGQQYVVTMGPYGGFGIGGTVVATTDPMAEGAFTATYQIPASMAGSYQIAIRMESPYNFAYNWFYNNTAP